MSFLDAIGAAFGKDPGLPARVERTADGYVVRVNSKLSQQASETGKTERIHLNFDPIAPAERADNNARPRSRGSSVS